MSFHMCTTASWGSLLVEMMGTYISHLFVSFFFHVYIYAIARACRKKSNQEYLLQVLPVSHTVPVTQSPWIPVVPVHCPRSGTPVKSTYFDYHNVPITRSSFNMLPELAVRGVMEVVHALLPHICNKYALSTYACQWAYTPICKCTCMYKCLS